MPQETRTIEQSVTVAAPPEQVFRALTDAGELEKWLPTTAQSDPRTGGRFHFFWEFTGAAADRNHTVAGEYLEVVPGRRVRYTWPAGHAAIPTEVAFDVEGTGNSSKVTLAHSGWTPGSEASQQEHDMGWAFFLANLKSWLESGTDARASKMGMKTTARA